MDWVAALLGMSVSMVWRPVFIWRGEKEPIRFLLFVNIRHISLNLLVPNRKSCQSQWHQPKQRNIYKHHWKVGYYGYSDSNYGHRESLAKPWDLRATMAFEYCGDKMFLSWTSRCSCSIHRGFGCFWLNSNHVISKLHILCKLAHIQYKSCFEPTAAGLPLRGSFFSPGLAQRAERAPGQQPVA